MCEFTINGTTHVAVCADSSSLKWPDGDTLFFDPPWQMISSIDVDADKYAAVLAFCDGQRSGDVVKKFGAPSWVFAWDCVSSWFVPGKPLKRAKNCFAYFDKWLTNEAVFIAKENAPRVVRNTRGEFMAGDARGVRVTDLFQHPITSAHASGHRHSKPIQWLSYLIAGVTPPNGMVIDPFAGSFAAAAASAAVGVNSWSCELEEFSGDEFYNAINARHCSNAMQNEMGF